MKFKVRFKFWKVAVGLVVMGLFFYAMYSISNSFSTRQEQIKEVPESGEHFGSGFSALHMFLFMLTFFYFSLNYYYSFIAANKRWYSFILLSAGFVLAVGLYYSFLYYNIPQTLQQEYDSWEKMFGSLLSAVLPMMLVSFIFAFGTYLWESGKQRRILEAQKLQLEAQISQANFNFLKAQINPHFLHNTLNFLYAKSLPYSTELSEGILTLSDIMRYALSQGHQKDGKAPLKDEIEHVNNVIKISQLRFSNKLNVNFEVSGQVNGKLIIPFVLITLVENAFKHGDLKDQQHPIDIKLSVQGNRLYFYCRNKKKVGPKQLSTGIGLENIRQRLLLAYGDKYKFKVKDDPEYYTTELTIEEL